MRSKSSLFLLSSGLVFVVACAASPGDAGTGGASGTGGAQAAGSGGKSQPGSGGSSGSGGAGTGGAVGSGGAAATGGSGAGVDAAVTDSGAASDGSSVPGASCTFSGVTATLSPKMGTVAIVTWVTDLAGVTEAKIDFGLDTQYGYTAPVDLKEPMYKTLLVGMKPSKAYHYRITAKGPSGSCSSGDQMVMSGTVGGGKVTMSPAAAPANSGWNFFLYGKYYGAGAQIIDKDGDTVWSTTSVGECSGARFSWDGKAIWLNSDNNGGGNSTVHLISLDGMSDQNLSSKFPGANHMIGPTPDGAVFVAGECGNINEYKLADGTTRTITTTQKLGITACHANNITYYQPDDSILLSELDSGTVTKFKRADGTKVWQINPGGQHGLHPIGADDVLVYVNPNTAVEFKGGMMIWSAKASGSTQVMGDAQRLPNGNTMISSSPNGKAIEVDKDGKMVRGFTQGSSGFSESRLTLYGPPIR